MIVSCGCVLVVLTVPFFGTDIYSKKSFLFFITEGDNQFTWVWFGVLFACGIILVALISNSILLIRIRYRTARPEKLDEVTAVEKEEDYVGGLPFQRANLTFTNIQYTVKSSVSNEEMTLLKGVTGYVAAGKMTALM